MKQTVTLLSVFLLVCESLAQVNYTANDLVMPYTGKFRIGINQGYYPGWDNKTLANISAGNPAVQQKGVGAKTVRHGLSEEVLGIFGYDLNVSDFQHFASLGMSELVAIVGGPLAWHKDFSVSSYCTNPASPNFGKPSNMFGNLYTPIWDGGLNGTPYNDNNYFAAYLYKVVNQYKNQVRFWEILNEPGLDLTGQLGWRDQNYPGNWWAEGPNPCDNILHAPIYHYIRTLRIAWEIIKTLSPDSYVCLGSVGYQSYMNALLSNTDNPNGGDVTPQYPLKGGAYFDCISYHSYPHFDGSTTNFSLGYFQRNSDEAADGVVKYRNYYQQILDQYGYNGITYPRKEWIMTETNSPRKVFGEAFPGTGTGVFFGGNEAQVNHMMKAAMVSKINKVHQLHIFQLIDQRNEWDANYEFHLMGTYKNLNGALPYNVQVNDLGKAMKTMTDLIWNTEYDATRTAAMNLPAGVRGYAFRRPDNSYIYAIWARTTQDLSENASAVYSFPSNFNMPNVLKYNWDYGYTNATVVVSSQNIPLNARPVFFTASSNPPQPCSINIMISGITCNNNGTPNNPSDDTFTFTITVSGNNTSGSWRANIAGQNVSGTMGTPVNLGPYPISGGNIAFVIADANNPACANEAVVVAPPACSTSTPPQPGKYCESKSDFPWHDWIAGVKIGSMDNPSGKSNYSDFTSKSTSLAAGSSHAVQLTAGFSYFTFNEHWRIWIDFNKNGTFESNEKVFEGIQNAPANGTPSAIFNGNVNIPSGAATGSTRMRVSMKRGSYAEPCDVLPFGEVEDYTVDITGGNSPCVISANVTNIQCNNNNTANNPNDDTYTFSLNVSGSGTGWVVNFGSQVFTGAYGTPTSFGPYPIANGNVTLLVRDNANANCTTTVTAVAPPTCSSGGGTSGNYCSVASDFPWHDWIAGVRIGNLNNSSGKSTYSNFTNVSADLQRGQPVSIQLTAGYSWFTFDEYWKIWIDFNKNGEFEEPAELVFSGILNRPANGTPSAVLNGSILLAANVPAGTTRMRVAMKRGAYASPCENLPFGEVEDYSVNILQNLLADSDVRHSSDPNSLPTHLTQHEPQFHIYPNPNNGVLWISLGDFSGNVSNFKIYNSQGLLVKSWSIGADHPAIFEVSLYDLHEGQYFIQLQSEKHRPLIRKFSVIR